MLMIVNLNQVIFFLTEEPTFFFFFPDKMPLNIVSHLILLKQIFYLLVINTGAI